MRVCVYLKNITLVEAMFNPKAEERRKKYKRYIRGIWDFILFQEDFFLNNILYFLYWVQAVIVQIILQLVY